MSAGRPWPVDLGDLGPLDDDPPLTDEGTFARLVREQKQRTTRLGRPPPSPEMDARFSPPVNGFHAHLDVCERCRERPFDPCAVGAEALQREALG